MWKPPNSGTVLMASLDEEERACSTKYMKCIAELGRRAKQPMDPKVEPLLEIIHALLGEQLILDKKYEWEPAATEDDKFLNEADIPSVDDLRRMMGGDQ